MKIQTFGVLSFSALALFASSTSSFAFGPESPRTAPTSKAEFCRYAGQGANFKELYESSDNLLTFSNRGGLSNGGVCWWHSRFQRLANYLMVFRPDLPKTSPGNARAIINAVSSGGRVVQVPGYRNLKEFSNDYRSYIQARLESWQREDAFLKFAWIKGLKGGIALTPASMKSQMEFIYREVVTEKRVVWNKLQVRGIAAHAWLVIDMAKTANGYDLQVLDSNRPSSVYTVHYRFGDTQLQTSAGRGVPTVDNWKELFKAGRTIRAYCGANQYPDFAR